MQSLFHPPQKGLGTIFLVFKSCVMKFQLIIIHTKKMHTRLFANDELTKVNYEMVRFQRELESLYL